MVARLTRLPRDIARGMLCLSFIFALTLPARAADHASALSGVRTWGYQLQRPNIARLAASPHDVVVIDYSKDGSDDGAFTKAEIDRIRARPDGRKRIVLAYLSIGEAETYRDYWRWYWGGKWYTNWMRYIFGPSWLGPENGSWGGNFAVRYWNPDWQARIVGPGAYLDRILAAGFDGVYLDKIDSSLETIAKGRPTAKDDMRAFVRRIAETGRASRANFAVVPQNGEELFDSDSYIELIDGIGKEDLLFGEFKEKQANPEHVVSRRIELLKRATAKGKTVLAVEYLDDPERIATARQRLQSLGFVPYFGDRELQTLRYGDLPATAH